MRRFSLFTFVILLPLIVAAWFAWQRHQLVSRQEQTLKMLHRALETGEIFPFARILTDFGRSEALKYFERADQSELLTFDGEARLAQIQKDGLTYREGTLDLLFLHDFENGHKTAIQQPPIGTVINSVVFVGDGVDISLHGDLLVNNSKITIPSGAPETYHLRWIPGSPPASPPLEALITKRQRP